jgi:hypothetical protein
VRAEDTELAIVQGSEESAQQIDEMGGQKPRYAARQTQRPPLIYVPARYCGRALILPIVRRAFFVRIGPPSQRLRRVWRVRRPLWVEAATIDASGSDGPKRWSEVLSVIPIRISSRTSTLYSPYSPGTCHQRET